MRNSGLLFAAIALSIFGAPAAYADVTCEPGYCVISGTSKLAPKASFSVTPSNVDANYRDSISANLGNTVTSKGAFTDTFNFLLPAIGGRSDQAATISASLHPSGEHRFYVHSIQRRGLDDQQVGQRHRGGRLGLRRFSFGRSSIRSS